MIKVCYNNLWVSRLQKKRKNELMELVLKKGSAFDGIIYRIIQNGYLDKVINKITDERVKTPTTSITKKGYLTGNEQFLDILNSFIAYFDRIFTPVMYKEACVSFVLEKETPKFLLSKKYCHDNDNLDEFILEYKRLMVNNVSNTLSAIYKYLDKKVMKEFKLEPLMNINDDVVVDRLLRFMIAMVWSNVDEYAIISLFSSIKIALNKVKPNRKEEKSKVIKNMNGVINHYAMHYSIMIENYKKKKKYINKIVKY